MYKWISILALLATAGLVQAAPQTFLCPEGQVLGGSGCVTQNQVVIQNPAKIVGYTCPAGSVLEGTKCITTKVIPATLNYTCPEGATLSGKTCVYNVAAPK